MMRKTAKSWVWAGWILAVGAAAQAVAGPPAFEFEAGDRVAFVGDAVVEGEQEFGFVELALTTRFPERDVTFRNLGWSGDTPAGASRAGLSTGQAGAETPAECFSLLVKQMQLVRPTVVVVGYGNASSFDGAAGVPRFREELERFVAAAKEVSQPDPVRFIFLGPTRDAPAYEACIRELARANGAAFVGLGGVLEAKVDGRPVTIDGLRLNADGYRTLARTIEQGLGWPAGRWDTAPEADRLRQEIIRKNTLFFHRSRPANMAYIFGFRNREQGRNAAEIPQFDPLIAACEGRIATLRSLTPVTLADEPGRTASIHAAFTPQPMPQFTLADGLELTLWAENPLLFKPIQINFDPRGRLWVASSEVYPQVEPGQTANDKIMILDDTDGDGKADASTVFADGLLIPTGLEPGDGGVYVAQSTELLHFQERDGRVVRRTLLSGFGTEDTHHDLHTLRWGPDGRLYMNQSIYTRTDAETPHGVVRLRGGGVFAYDTKARSLEILFRGWVNSWGHAFDRYGQSFLTDGAGSDGVSYGVPGAMYRATPGARRLLKSASLGSYPKFCGLEQVSSPLFPDDWQGNLITCDFRANRIVRFTVADEGAGFLASQIGEIVRADQGSFRPIDVKVGPDGALYIADWSNPIINHGEVDFRDPRRDREHGRIWRLGFKGRKPLPRRDLTKLATPAVLDLLLSASGYERQQARRVLAERGREVLAPLDAWVASHPGDEPRLESLWLREAVGADTAPARAAAVAARSGPVRAAAVRRATEQDTLVRAVTDEHPRVRLEAVRALGRAAGDPTPSLDAALAVRKKPMDRFLEYGLWLTAGELGGPWLDALAAGRMDFAARAGDVREVLAAVAPERARGELAAVLAKHGIPVDGAAEWIDLIGLIGTPRELRMLFDRALAPGADGVTVLRSLSGLLKAARGRNAKPDGALSGLDRFLAAGQPDDLRSTAIGLVGAWRLGGLAPAVEAIARDVDAPQPCRLAALDAVRQIGSSHAPALFAAVAADDRASLAIRQRAAALWLATDAAQAAPVVAAMLGTDREFWQAVVEEPACDARLAAAVRDRRLPADAAAVGLSVVRPRRKGNADLVRVLETLAGVAAAREYRPEDVQRFTAAVARDGDASRGEAIFRRNELRCVACHAVSGAGGRVGPDLMAIGASAPADYIVEALLLPNAKVKEGYHAVNVVTDEGKTIAGIVVKDTPDELVLRDAENKEVTIPKPQIEERATGPSLMPVGLMQPLIDDEIRDLARFLTELGKPGPYDVTKTRSPRYWRIAPGDESSGSPREDGAELIYTTVAGELPKGDVRTPDAVLDLATRFDIGVAGTATIDLGEGPLLGAWIDGARLDTGREVTRDLQPGSHTLVVRRRAADLPARWKVTAPGLVFRSE